MPQQTIKEAFDAALKEQMKMVEEKDYSNIDKVMQMFNDILNVEPENIQSLQNLAVCHLIKGNNGLAINMLQRVVERIPEYDGAWANLGIAYRAEGKNKEALQSMKKAILINRSARNLENLGSMYVNEGIPDKGIQYLEESINLDPTESAYWNLGLLLLEQCDRKKGFMLYEAGLICKERYNRIYPDKEGSNVPIWTGQTSIDGRRPVVVVYGEQGLGDELMFATAMEDLLEKVDVIFDCHPRLTHLFTYATWASKLSAIYGTRKKEFDQIDWYKRYDIDFKLPIGSLFRWFRTEDKWPRKAILEGIPPLDLSQYGPGPYIGIGWSGGTKRTHELYRSVSFTDMLDQIRGKPGTFVSLNYQQKFAKEDIEHAKSLGTLPDNFVEIDVVYEKDYQQTAKLLAALDACILPNTSAVHLAGCMGVLCYTFTPIQKAWRYCSRNDRMVMYPSVEIVQQVHGEPMKAVMGRAIARIMSNDRQNTAQSV